MRGTLDHSTQVIYQGDLQMCESALHAFVHVTLVFFCIGVVQWQVYISGFLCDVTPALSAGLLSKIFVMCNE